ncbi:hypothetical protein THZG08_680008 [Vibrio owensii]|uniref:hypothetical protein n=1 Tax=Vibrio owensii TaxID=696485 RepID=UPI0028941CB0|nr:hypothetical protein THZG08_680008 [Vibrio owensii]CAH1589757.1 hypothetical protein THOA03_670008 [Vibrio owensii]
MEIFSIIIATVSLLVSIVAIYHSVYKKPDLTAHIGPQIVAIYNSQDLCITVPVTIANSSPNIGTVKRCTLTVTPMNKGNQNWHMTWDSFRTITADGATWVQKGVAHSIPVLSRSKSSENIQFKWSRSNSERLEFVEGGYKFRMDFWTTKNEAHLFVEHDLYISKDDASKLSATQTSQKGTTNTGVVYLSLDSETSANKLLTDNELKSWLS